MSEQAKKPVLPIGSRPEPVRQEHPFFPVFCREVSPRMRSKLYEEAEGWTARRKDWKPDMGAARQWPNPRCSAFSATNAYHGLIRHRGMPIRSFRPLDADDIHEDAQELDGLAGGAAETRTTIEASAEAICEAANHGHVEPWVFWAPVEFDWIGAWIDRISPVAVSLEWPHGWLGYSAVWKTLLHTHDRDPIVTQHAVALVGHNPAKTLGWNFKKGRTFDVHDSCKSHVVHVEAGALSKRFKRAVGFITARDLERLRQA